jgi:HEAT repeat protein
VKLVATGELAEHDLTYAAEALGLIDDANTPMVVKVLAWLSHHHSPIVREGVVYGLGRLLARSKFAGQVLAVLAKDPSPEVRTAAVEALEV